MCSNVHIKLSLLCESQVQKTKKKTNKKKKRYHLTADKITRDQ